MEFGEFGEDDVLVNVHGYRKYDRNGLVKEPVEQLADAFPGDVYGVAEAGCGDDLYGREHMPDGNVIRSWEEQGWFDARDLGMADADHAVLTGGYVNACLSHTYEILVEEELQSGTEVILPPDACFAYLGSSNPDIGEYTLEMIQKGGLDCPDDHETYFMEQLVENAQINRYDWYRTSIQDISGIA